MGDEELMVDWREGDKKVMADKEGWGTRMGCWVRREGDKEGISNKKGMVDCEEPGIRKGW